MSFFYLGDNQAINQVSTKLSNIDIDNDIINTNLQESHNILNNINSNLNTGISIFGNYNDTKIPLKSDSNGNMLISGSVSISSMPSVSIDNYPSTQTIAGAVDINNQITGFATQTTLAQLNDKITSDTQNNKPNSEDIFNCKIWGYCQTDTDYYVPSITNTGHLLIDDLNTHSNLQTINTSITTANTSIVNAIDNITVSVDNTDIVNKLNSLNSNVNNANTSIVNAIDNITVSVDNTDIVNKLDSLNSNVNNANTSIVNAVNTSNTSIVNIIDNKIRDLSWVTEPLPIKNLAGKCYGAQRRNALSSSTFDFFMYLNNPAGSGKYMAIYNLSFAVSDDNSSARMRTSINLYNSAMTTSGATAIDYTNLLVNSNGSTISNVSIMGYGGSNSGYTSIEHIQTRADGNTVRNDFQEEFIILEPNSSLVIEASGDNAAAIGMCSIRWFEENKN
jgi:hypothetical protein